jgi:ABC-2 type transport system ATP-binding protein
VTALAELRGVSKAFPRAQALDGIDLRIGACEVVALLGPNGAGKTTAIRLLLGLRRPDAGRALLFGLDPRRPEARRRCGATPQETDLPETLRVREIVELVRAHFAHPVATQELLDRFGVLELAERQAGGLSGGERRRVAVGLAFAGDPDLVFLDEPSSGLDAATKRRLWESIRSFAARGRAILLTTHDLGEAEALATRVIVLDRGRVRVEGSVAEIASRTGLHRVRVKSQPLPPLAGVEQMVENGRYLMLLTRSTGELIRALVAVDADLEELEVAPAGLEQTLALEAPS